MNEATSGVPAPPARPPEMEALLELAMDLRWTWNHGSDELWRRLDPELWALTQHPNVVLQTVARERLASALADADFRQLLERLLQAKRQAAVEPAGPPPRTTTS